MIGQTKWLDARRSYGPQMKCPHCDKSIAVRLEQPGKKAARRRTLRARKAQKLREIETSNEEE